MKMSMMRQTKHSSHLPRNRHATSFLIVFMLVFAIGLAGCAFPFSSEANPDSPDGTPENIASCLTFRTEEKLQQHFEKHGWEVGCATAEEYLAAANAVVANPAALHKLQAEDGDDLYFLESTGEFVVVSPAGYLRTYYLTDRDYFERQ